MGRHIRLSSCTYDPVLQPGHISAVLTVFQNINDDDLAVILVLLMEEEEEENLQKKNKTLSI